MDLEATFRRPCCWGIGAVDIFNGEFRKLDNPFRGIEFKLKVSIVPDSPC
jgi:hypothetical protein